VTAVDQLSGGLGSLGDPGQGQLASGLAGRAGDTRRRGLEVPRTGPSSPFGLAGLATSLARGRGGNVARRLRRFPGAIDLLAAWWLLVRGGCYASQGPGRLCPACAIFAGPPFVAVPLSPR